MHPKQIIIDINYKTMRKYLSTLLVASVLIASCSKEAEVIREKIVSQSRPILSGQGQPDNGKGEDGDYYLDLTNAKLYGPKTQGAWGESSLDLKGVAGKNGKDGKDGANGVTPTVSEDGYWVVNGQKTDIKARGNDGQPGANGVTPTISEDGYWVVNGQKTDIKARGNDGQPGAPGQPGANGQTPTITISEDGYWVINGQKTTEKARGNDGQPGAPGRPGANGQTPTITISEDGYWMINGQKTTEKARGNDGQPGRPGADGHTPTISINEAGYWVINGVASTTKARGENGSNGQTPTISINEAGYWVINGVASTTKARGENGVAGSKILAEDRAPQATDGVKGDYFIDKAAKIFYGPKTDAGWPTTGIYLGTNQILSADYQLSEDGKTLVKWINPKTRFIDMNADPKLKEVTKIGNVAFDKQANGINYQLTTIIVGDKVTEIGNSAFRTCDRLKSVELPEGITKIENGTFEGCVRLQIIEIPESVTSIGDGAFSTCVKLSSVILPEHVNSLGNLAFGNCASLHSIIIRNKTPFAIGTSVFQGTPIQNIYVFSEKVDDYKNVVAVPYKNKVKALDFPGDN